LIAAAVTIAVTRTRNAVSTDVERAALSPEVPRAVFADLPVRCLVAARECAR